MSADNLEVHRFQGNEGERVPETVERLTFKPGVQVVPDKLCYDFERLREVSLPLGLTQIGVSSFHWCENLSEINICGTVQVIGTRAFSDCYLLKKVDFEVSSRPQQLRSIGSAAFSLCSSLSRMTIPATVTSIGQSTFNSCHALKVANLSATNVQEISDWTFYSCSSLQTVSLPRTVERIGRSAFYDCLCLLTVRVPAHSHPIKIGETSFQDCKILANFLLPKDSTADANSFTGCATLYDCYGDDTPRIVTGLMGRFENFAIHRMCYDQSTITAGLLRQCITDQQAEDLLVDQFGMTPFHIFFSMEGPRAELLDVLMDSLPHQLLNCMDANCMRPLEYFLDICTNGTPNPILQRVLWKWMVGPLSRWGIASWVDTMQNKVQEILADEDKTRTATLIDEAHALLECFENIQATSILEMALWNEKLKSGSSVDAKRLNRVNRDKCRCLSGSDVVIPHVTAFLGIPLSTGIP